MYLKSHSSTKAKEIVHIKSIVEILRDNLEENQKSSFVRRYC